MRKFALIVAAGESQRMGGDIPKPYQLLEGRPILFYSLRAFWEAYDDIEIIVVRHPSHAYRVEEIMGDFPGRVIQQVSGGGTRFQSVRHGIQSIHQEGVVWVHDAARPLLRPELIRRLYEDCLREGSAVPVIAAVDSYRQIKAEGVSKSLERSSLRLVQTPQTFFWSTLIKAMSQEERPEFTDEASVVEALGHEIYLTEGQKDNLKMTWPMDIHIAVSLIRNRSKE